MNAPNTFDAGDLLREAAAGGARTHIITIRIGGKRMVRARLTLAVWLLRLASWAAYGMIVVCETNGAPMRDEQAEA
jgi:hypothetical protein